MTDDLVKRLRSGDYTIKMTDGSIQYLNHVAADRIEQLEAALDKRNKELETALKRIGELLSDETYYEPCIERFCGELARAALGEKKDD